MPYLTVVDYSSSRNKSYNVICSASLEDIRRHHGSIYLKDYCQYASEQTISYVTLHKNESGTRCRFTGKEGYSYRSYCKRNEDLHESCNKIDIKDQCQDSYDKECQNAEDHAR